MQQRKSTTLSFDAFKREQFKNIKIRAANNALAEEFALAEKRIKARKRKKLAPLRTTPPKPIIRRRKQSECKSHGA